MIDQEIIRKKKTHWTRQQAKILSLVQELESEIENLKKKNIHPDFIQKKSDQLDLIIEAINYADEFIQLLIFSQSSAALEIFFLEKSLTQEVSKDLPTTQKFFSKDHSYELVRAMVQTLKDGYHAAE